MLPETFGVRVSWTYCCSMPGPARHWVRCTTPCSPRQATGGRAPSITVGAGHSALEPLHEMVSSASVAGTAATGCLGSARKARLFRTAPLPSAAYRVPMPEREQTELERDVAARELANELDEQPKRRGYVEWRVGWKPERGRFETWSSGSSTVIEEPDEAERQRVMDELGAAAQLILARQWKAEERRQAAAGAPGRDVPLLQ